MILRLNFKQAGTIIRNCERAKRSWKGKLKIMEQKNNFESLEMIAENIFQVIPLLKKRLAHISAFQSKYGLPLSHFQVLSLLEERGSMSVSEISEYFDIAKPSITPLVDRLVNAGLVDRVRSTTDRRVVFIVILDEGRERLKTIREMLVTNVEEWKRSLTDEEFRLLAESMSNVVTFLKKI